MSSISYASSTRWSKRQSSVLEKYSVFSWFCYWKRQLCSVLSLSASPLLWRRRRSRSCLGSVAPKPWPGFAVVLGRWQQLCNQKTLGNAIIQMGQTGFITKACFARRSSFT